MTSPWIKEPGTDDASLLLYCVAHAGGGGSFFRSWRTALEPRIGVCPVVLPGRESRLREAPLTAVEHVVPPLAEAIRSHADRPYALFGHSMGAVVAYEVARRLSTITQGPSRLFVSGRRAPHLPARRPELHALGPDEFLPAVAAMGGTPEEVLRQKELMAVFLPGLRADFRVNETYQQLPGPPLRCPVSALTGDADPEVDVTEMRSWAEVTTGDFSLRVFSGGHFYLAGPPPELAEALRADLAVYP
ncbi:thioesterase II family protein [Micromonospora sp. NBC_01796]|uniref:thioesterase II family protein n=1 Tax=Micromonospora sp. NBC_01796 TaxID=2975987 RepID=UPI002DD85872|nr:alpha/beta fold hydrolase [Micromonospora sp. NBC_01796]WSA84101.1 alpha/beta fold hydrolase [Micromonospora sp. NBC_01796]